MFNDHETSLLFFSPIILWFVDEHMKSPVAWNCTV